MSQWSPNIRTIAWGGAAPKTINEDVGYLLRIPRECQIFAVKRLLGQLRCVVSNDSRQFA
jgi:hypothetical protein